MKKLDNKIFEIYHEQGDIKIEELNLKDIVSIKENTPELEDIIFELFSNFKEKEQEK